MTSETNILKVENLSLQFGKKAAFKNISLDIPEKQLTAIVGPSGCGKSSFLTCLNRMVEFEPHATMTGNIYFQGKPINALPSGLVRKKIGMIYQKPTPFPFSIEKNFQIPLEEYGLRKKADWAPVMEDALRRVGLWGEVKDRLQRAANNLSGGQQQRLCIARALALEPEVLLMDEPCSALDPLSSEIVENLIMEISSQLTIVIVTHNLAQAKRISHNLAFFWWCHGAGCLMEKGRTMDVFSQPRNAETQSYIQSERVL